MNLFGSRRALIAFVAIISVTIVYGGLVVRDSQMNLWRQAAAVPTFDPLAPPPPRQDKCVIATAGKLLVADSRGNVCERFALGRTSHANCCAPGEPHTHLSCNTCQLSSSSSLQNGGRECCELFEYCVSCCMRRHIELDGRLGGSGGALMPHAPSPARNFTIFSWCALSCRTNSQTVVGRGDQHCIFDMPPPASDQSLLLSSPSSSHPPSPSPSTSPTPVPADHWIEF